MFNKTRFPFYSHDSLSIFSSLLFPLSLLSSLSRWMWSGDGSSPTMVLVQQWWSDSHGSNVVWWSPSLLSPLSLLLCHTISPKFLSLSFFSFFSSLLIDSLSFFLSMDRGGGGGGSWIMAEICSDLMDCGWDSIWFLLWNLRWWLRFGPILGFVVLSSNL